MKRINHILENFAGAATAKAPLAIIFIASLASLPFASAQIQWPPAPPTAVHTSYAWTGGSADDALAQSQSLLTIPMSTFTHVASKDGKKYSSTIVGTNPFDKASWSNSSVNPINAVVIPLAFTGAVNFDPTAADPCDKYVSNLTRFQNSPLTQNVPLTMEGVNVGTTQFINGFRRAEFWLAIGGSAAYQNPINFTYRPLVSIAGAPIAVQQAPCPSGTTSLGILPANQLRQFLETYLIPQLNLNPQTFVLFLVHNIVQADGPGVDLGFHGAVGSPVQTYAIADWNTTSAFPGAEDASVASHEIAEWMDDPLVTNLTPPWGYVGQVSGCVSTWEAGDPLTGKVMPLITVPSDASKFPYHMQELAFYSFFFNSPTDPSVGASYYIYREGTFSANGSFLSAANVCPSGGLAPFGGKVTLAPITGPSNPLVAVTSDK